MNGELIVFLKYPYPGRVKTRLASDLGEQRACELYRDFAERVIAEVYPINGVYTLSLYLDPMADRTAYEGWLGAGMDLHMQRGEDLGERLSNAIQCAFENGKDKVIVIGSDCIGFDEETLCTWFENLDQRDLVVGPASDGGYYLIGMKQHHPRLFESVPWSSDQVLDVTLKRAKSLGLTLWQLEERIDVDTIEDLTKLRTQLAEEHFLAKKIDRLILDRLGLDDTIEVE